MKNRGTKDSLVRVAQNLYRSGLKGKYYGRKIVAGRDAVHCLETSDRKLADGRLVKWIATLGKVKVDAGKFTLGDLVDLWKSERVNRSPKTRKNDDWIANKMKFGFDFTKRANLIRPADLVSWLAAQKETGVGDRSYNYFCLALSQIFDLAEREGVFEKSPYTEAKIKWKRVSRKVPKLPTETDFEEILKEIRAVKFGGHGKDAGDFVEFLGRAALGQAEAAGLTWGNIDFTAWKMQVRRRKTGKYFFVPIYPKLRPLLQRMRSEVIATETTPVFKIKDAKLAINGAIKRINKARVVAAKMARVEPKLMPHFSQRNFRQMAIKQLVRAGVDVQLIAKWQAHGDGGKLVMDTYSQGDDSEDAQYELEQLAKVA